MASFLVFFEVCGSVVAVYPPKSGYPSAEAPYFDSELQFLVAAARDGVPKVVLYSVLWGMDEDN